MKDMTSIVVCFPVPQEAVDLVWDQVAPMLEGATLTARGKCDIQDVRDGIDAGDYLLWVAEIDGEIVAAITTRIIDYPRCRAMALDWIGGKRMKEWIEVVNNAMVTHARHNGCTHLEGYGRDAWLRWTSRLGWKEDYTAFRMEI